MYTYTGEVLLVLEHHSYVTIYLPEAILCCLLPFDTFLLLGTSSWSPAGPT